MAERTVVVASRAGLHARPAALFSEAAGRAGIPVTLTDQAGRSVNAASILAVLTLGVAHGARVTVAAESESVVDELAVLLATDLDGDTDLDSR